MNLNPQYSVIVPVYNSEESLSELLDGIRSVFHQMDKTFEVIFVEDCSKDKSWEVLNALKAGFSENITAVKLSKNFGQHNALLCGFSFAKGDFIITIDDDLQTPPAEIVKLIECYSKSSPDMVYGCYADNQHSRIRRIGSASIKKSSRLFRKTLDRGSSFRLIRAELVQKLLLHQQYFIFLDEVLQWYTSDIAMVEVRHEKRKYNRTNYSSGKILKLVADLLFFYTTIPLKLLVYGGFTLSLVSFAIGLHYIFKKVFLNVPIPGYTSLIVAILFSTSIILFSLGVIGEYLSRIYSVQNRKPPYSIKKIV